MAPAHLQPYISSVNFTVGVLSLHVLPRKSHHQRCQARNLALSPTMIPCTPDQSPSHPQTAYICSLTCPAASFQGRYH